jgi:hypothetical protein
VVLTEAEFEARLVMLAFSSKNLKLPFVWWRSTCALRRRCRPCAVTELNTCAIGDLCLH